MAKAKAKAHRDALRKFGASRRWFVLSTLLAPSTCHDFAPDDTSTRESGGTSGSATGGGVTGGSAASDGGSVTGGEGNAGEGGSPRGGTGGGTGVGGTGGMSGASGTGGAGAGMGGEGGAGEGGGAGGPEPGALGIYGAVRVLRDGAPVCGGTLITNSWVLTADRCIPAGTTVSSIDIGFGLDSNAFYETRHAVELQRYPGNDGTDLGRVRDLVLIGVDRPFTIDGKTTQHVLQPWPRAGSDVLGRHRCVAWDLEPDAGSPTDRLRSEFLVSFFRRDDEPYGPRVTWANSNPDDPDHGTQLTENDFGSACFVERDGTPYLMTVHSACPSGPGEACSVMVASPAIQDWLDGELYQVQPPNSALSGIHGVCSFGRDSLEVFSLASDTVHWSRQKAWPSGPPGNDPGWSREPPLPPNEAGPMRYRPAAYCAPDGSIELLVGLGDGTVWWERFRYDPKSERHEWAEQWAQLEGVATTSGLTIAGVASGHFHLFGRDAGGELRHSEYRGDTWIKRWERKGLITDGSPSAWLGNVTWMNVFARGSGNSLGIWATIDGNVASAWTYSEGTTFSDAAAVGWLPMRWDVFFINQDGVIERTWGDLSVATTVATGLDPAGDSINAVSRERGSIDIVADGWHAIWPRDPISGERAAWGSDR